MLEIPTGSEGGNRAGTSCQGEAKRKNQFTDGWFPKPSPVQLDSGRLKSAEPQQ